MKKIFISGLLLILGGCASPYSADNLPYLKGKTATQVQSTFGEPHAVRKESNAMMWSYYQDECSSLVFFDANETVQYAELRGKCAKTFAEK